MHLADVKTTEVLSMDEVAIIFSFLSHHDIMRARVCTAWKEAAKETLVPMTMTPFVVDSMKSYNAMRAMSTALPNLQWIEIIYKEHDDITSGGEESDEEAVFAETVNYHCLTKLHQTTQLVIKAFIFPKFYLWIWKETLETIYILNKLFTTFLSTQEQRCLTSNPQNLVETGGPLERP